MSEETKDENDEFEKFRAVDNRTVFLMLQNQDRRMGTLERKFDDLLEKIDERMGQLIDVLADRTQTMIPVKTFTQVLIAVIAAIFVAMFGKDVVIDVFKEMKNWIH